jgi:hypothetical protein
MIKIKHAAEPLASPYRCADTFMWGNRPQQVGCRRLVIPLAVVVRHILADRIAELRPIVEDHSIQALGGQEVRVHTDMYTGLQLHDRLYPIECGKRTGT